jgi:uncharacterized membrane protein
VDTYEQWMHGVWQPVLGHGHAICIYGMGERSDLLWTAVFLVFLVVLMVVVHRRGHRRAGWKSL